MVYGLLYITPMGHLLALNESSKARNHNLVGGESIQEIKQIFRHVEAALIGSTTLSQANGIITMINAMSPQVVRFPDDLDDLHAYTGPVAELFMLFNPFTLPVNVIKVNASITSLIVYNIHEHLKEIAKPVMQLLSWQAIQQKKE